MNDKPILLCGYLKSGNTWTRFVVMNYFNILNNNAQKTLTFDELNEINHHRIERMEILEPNDYEKYLISFKEGFPAFVRTNRVINEERLKFKKFFDKIIYIYRNPYDTMISYHQYSRNRIGLEKMSLEEFIHNELSRWFHHILIMYKQADLILRYRDLRQNPNLFKKVLELFVDEIDEDIFQKAIEMSSFENIRNMSVREHQEYGLYKGYKGMFCRDGHIGQYLKGMDIKLIRWIENFIKDRLQNVKKEEFPSNLY